MTPTAGTIAVLSLCGFFGNVGAALTGFGEAIVFLFFWQVIDLAGYDYGNFKHANFIQAPAVAVQRTGRRVTWVLFCISMAIHQLVQ